MITIGDTYEKRGFVILNAKEYLELEWHISGIKVSQSNIEDYLDAVTNEIGKLSGTDHDIAMIKRYLMKIKSCLKYGMDDMCNIQKIME
jgi:hypothetical protein